MGPRPFEIGPVSREQLDRIARTWRQGQHVLVTGGTGSGKTVLARELDEIRLKSGGSVVVFVCKMGLDQTLAERYKGFTRWTTWHKYPSTVERRILFWPKVERKTPREAVALMKAEFTKALDEIGKVGLWTVHIDEGLFVSHPAYLGLSNTLGMMYALMRSSNGTMITLAQRPAHLPVTIYPNLSHAFVGRASELPDIRRLADMDGMTNSRQIRSRIQSLGEHDFLWIPVGHGQMPEVMNLRH